MGQNRVEDAIQRIEQALTRVERSSAAPAAAPTAQGEGPLQEAHYRLRSRVEEAVAQIDDLLASGDRG